MPAGGSITKEQLERDIVRTRKEIDRLKQQETNLIGTYKMYFPTYAKAFLDADRINITLPVLEESVESLSIAAACEVIFRDLHNQWLTLADLDNELRRREKICSKGSIEIMLKAAPQTFDVEKRGKKNYYRLKGESDAVEDSRATAKSKSGQR
jgi:hypothetical protein